MSSNQKHDAILSNPQVSNTTKMSGISAVISEKTTPLYYTERERVMYERLGQAYAWYQVLNDEIQPIEQSLLSAHYEIWPSLTKFKFKRYADLIVNEAHVMFEVERIQAKSPATSEQKQYIEHLNQQRRQLYPEWNRAKKALEYIESEKAYLRAFRELT
ncbi:hypothetical protein [Photobacterium minamisatsumaniensis]|uniref:hypothetical protein n=1 Tax=Photobacterium minamisatsumaniensis TaxID=2910233 RepID=UPI003D138088